MPQSVSAKKSQRKNTRRCLRNRSKRSALRTQLKKCETALASSNVEAAAAELPKTARSLDRAAAQKLIHPNTAARRKSRLTKKANALKAQPKSE